jgi:photosystem II stability/assembly factor-like uncharacterized protein
MSRGALAALLGLCAAAAPAAEPVLQIEALASPVKVRLRGLSAFSDEIAWASGREGTVLRTIDGGKHWDVFKVPGAAELDFRDVQAFGAEVALVMGAGPGDASRVYRTADGGRSWTLVLRNPDAKGFFDCMDFNGEGGRLLGDPVNGRFRVFASSDGGRSWRGTRGPMAKKDEAAFAASGTCLLREPDGTLLVTGGSAARVHFLPDRIASKGDWRAIAVPGFRPAASAGLFSIAPRGGNVVAVGGDYKQETGPALVYGATAWGNAFVTGLVPHDGEVILQRGEYFSGSPAGYRSGIACEETRRAWCIAVGPSGVDALGPTLSVGELRGAPVPDGPVDDIADSMGVPSEWRQVAGAGYDSVEIAGGVAWFSGDEGRLGRMQLPAPRQ